MPDSTNPEQGNPLLLESEDDSRSSLEYSADKFDFEKHGDPENPLEWPDSYKWGVVTLLSVYGCLITFTCISIAPIAGYIVEDLDGSRGGKSATVMLVTIWEVGEAVGPLYIAPLSEIFGRYRLYLVMNTIFVTATVLAALSPSTGQLLASRALMGLSAASNVLNPAIIGDMFAPEQRGTAISLITFIPLGGGTLGPAISGIVLQFLGWRTVIWLSVVMGIICQTLFFTYFQETYKVRILQKRASRLSIEIGESEKNRQPPMDLVSLKDSILRPATIFFNSSVLVVLLVAGSFIFSHFYIVSTTLPEILKEVYGFSPTATGLAFIANGIGTVVSFVISKVSLDRIYVKLRARNHGVGCPEYRLPLSIIGAMSLPPAVILYGLCAEYRLPVIVLLFTIIWIRASIMLSSSPLTAYIVDACGIYSASAMAGFISVRCLAGALIPLAVSKLTGTLGYGGAFSVVGAIGLVAALVPVLVYQNGARWRQRSLYTAGNS